MKANVLLLAALTAAACGPAASQELGPPLVTDRPDQTESPSVVPHGHLQIETGTVYETNLWRHDPSEPEWSTLQVAGTLLRLGFHNWAELRIASAFRSEHTKTVGHETVASGLESLALGAKIALFAESGYAPQAALIASLNLPIGSEVFRPEGVEPTFLFAFVNTLSERVSLGYNLGVGWPAQAGRVLHYTASLGYTLSDKWAAFVELYGDDELSQPATLLFDAGATYLLRRALQIDFSAGFALSQDLPGWFVSGGLSLRLPD